MISRATVLLDILTRLALSTLMNVILTHALMAATALILLVTFCVLALLVLLIRLVQQVLMCVFLTRVKMMAHALI
jgi:hypothetical protein